MSNDSLRAPTPAVATLTRALPPTTPRPYRPAAAGPSAVLSSFAYAAKTSGLRRGLHVFLNVNQSEGFDCPGCAWPDPQGHRATFEFCENGAKAVADETAAPTASDDMRALGTILYLLVAGREPAQPPASPMTFWMKHRDFRQPGPMPRCCRLSPGASR